MGSNVNKNFNYNDFCKSKKCPEYIEWSFGEGSECVSCKLVGQSYDIDEVPNNCLFSLEAFKYKYGLGDEDMINDI